MMRRTASEAIRNLELRVASLEKQAHVNQISHIIRTSNEVSDVEDATVRMSFVGFAEGISNQDVPVPPALHDAFKRLGIRSPDDILYLYNNIDKIVDMKNPIVVAMKEKADRERTVAGRMKAIQEMIDNYDPTDPLGYYEWLGQGSKTLNKVTDWVFNKQQLGGVVFMLIVVGGATLNHSMLAFIAGSTTANALAAAGIYKVFGVVIAAYLAIRILGWTATMLTNFFMLYLLPLLLKAGVRIIQLKDVLWSGLKGIGRKVVDSFDAGVSKLKSLLGFGHKSASYRALRLLPL